MPDFDLTGELSLKIELHMLRPITEKVHSGNGPVSLVARLILDKWSRPNLIIGLIFSRRKKGPIGKKILLNVLQVYGFPFTKLPTHNSYKSY